MKPVKAGRPGLAVTALCALVMSGFVDVHATPGPSPDGHSPRMPLTDVFGRPVLDGRGHPVVYAEAAGGAR